jgi:L-fuconolactonase
MDPKDSVLCRDRGPDDLAPLLREAQVERTVVVQAAPTVAETRYLLKIAASTDWVAGVVGWVDLAAPDAAR